MEVEIVSFIIDKTKNKADELAGNGKEVVGDGADDINDVLIGG